MIAADHPVQRARDARMLVVDERGGIRHALRAQFMDVLRPGDLVVANDAATLPASLRGVHCATGADIEIRLAGKPSLSAGTPAAFLAVAFGAGDFRTPTEDRPLPPVLTVGDRLQFGSLMATVEGFLDHPRLIAVRFDGPADRFWAGLARHGRPIQYTHMAIPLELWDVWTPIASLPIAFEPPSASFAVDWRLVRSLRERDIGFATISVAAGISSTGDGALDARLPLDEPYRVSRAAARAIATRKGAGGRLIAVGTTVLRALEHSAGAYGHVRAGDGLATQRIGPGSRLLVVDAILTGTHEPGVSHYELLHAFADDETLTTASAELDASGYRTHEFGDSMFLVRSARMVTCRSAASGRKTIVPAA